MSEIEWTAPDEQVDCIVHEGQRCTHMACQATEDQNRHEASLQAEPDLTCKPDLSKEKA